MTNAELLHLLESMDWARERVLAALAPLGAEELRRPLGGSFGTIEATLRHIYGAERIWTERLAAGEGGGAPWPTAAECPNVAAIGAAWRETAAALRAWLAAQPADAPARVVHYRNSKGEDHATPVANVVLQLSHHQAYHRGQITHMLRQLGHAAPATDYIAFYRQQRSA